MCGGEDRKVCTGCSEMNAHMTVSVFLMKRSCILSDKTLRLLLELLFPDGVCRYLIHSDQTVKASCRSIRCPWFLGQVQFQTS